MQGLEDCSVFFQAQVGKHRLLLTILGDGSRGVKTHGVGGIGPKVGGSGDENSGGVVSAHQGHTLALNE